MPALGGEARSDVFVCTHICSTVCKAKTARAGPEAFYVSKMTAGDPILGLL